ncbi:Histone deacetylase HOS3 [Pseudocercospora fuligena]|uniref:Histone deacetylase HOS3 n=1 Tax=Pseudocercospora fuligena TaxID=685502 RepID=A0A8H6RJB7_9PEZI|nr:Histone deacetylase HOS3 [Pseudocercospora fuligena]
MDTPTVPDTGQDELPNRNHISVNTNDLSQPARHMSIGIATTTDAQSPISSAPNTPGLKTPLSRRASNSLNVAANSPKQPLRRPSSSASLNNNRPPSSPRLMRKSSRSSIGGGGTPDENDYRPSPKRSISNLISGLREAQSTMEAIEEPMPLTAAQIATSHFTKELFGHAEPGADAETIVILHDACYGHRWSRLKTPKSHLSLIVERPERIHASILGASTAYVRLGGHHASGKHAPHPDLMGPTKPPFKIQRSARCMDITSSFVTNVHGTAWMTELQGMCHSAPDKLAAGTKEISRDPTPGAPAKQELHSGDLYLAPGSLDAFQGALGGVADAIDTVFNPATRTQRAFVAVRPPGHHCSADHPSGFCWLNNVHVGIEYAAQTYGLTHAAILDFDLHHGDGSQAITWQRNGKNYEKRLAAKPHSKLKLNPDIGYYSLHDINSYPCEMGDDEKVQAASLCIENAHNQSVWNVHLQPWTTQAEFWKLYEDRYRILLDKAKIFLQHHATRIRQEGRVQPKTAIFISAGFDASEHEGAGMQRHKVSVPTDFYARFTEDVVKLAKEIDGCDGRVISVLEGGYSDRALCSGVLSHLSGLCASPVNTQTSGVETLMDLSERMGGLGINGSTKDDSLRYDSDWWSVANLTALEHKVNPPPPPQAKKVRSGPQPTYATPTESFAYKVVDADKFARSISGTMRESAMPARPLTPPPPEVDWVVATQELSNLLIPADRQTKSCTVEELAGPKKEKQPAAPLENVPKTRQLRDRRAKFPAYAESAHSDETASARSVSRTESRTSRRETIATLPSENVARRASRRLSAGSALDATSSSSIAEDAPPVPAVPAMPAKTAMKPPPVPANSIANKKTRASSGTRLPVNGSTTKPEMPVAKPVRQAPSAASASAAKSNGNVDSLTSGMKKVTLKVSSTKEEHDAKQKAQLDAKRRATALKGAETRRVNAAAKKAAQANATAQAAPKVAHAAPKAVPAPPAAQPVQPVPVNLPPDVKQQPSDVDSRMTGVEESSKENVVPSTMSDAEWGMSRVPSIQMDTSSADGPVAFDTSSQHAAISRSATPIEVPAAFNVPAENLDFPEYANSDGGLTPPVTTPTIAPAVEPIGLPVAGESEHAPLWNRQSSQNSSVPPQSELWMKPEANGVYEQPVQGNNAVHPPWTPRPAKPGDLPVFTSTGAIPFGKVPESPQRLWKAQAGQPQPSDSKLHNLFKQDQKTTDQQSVWEVPETPAK